MSYSPEDVAPFTSLYWANLVPLRVVRQFLAQPGSSATFTADQLKPVQTLEDEVRHIWTQKLGIGKFAYLFVRLGSDSAGESAERSWKIRYYTILLLAFDAVQIHVFALPGVPSRPLSVFASLLCLRTLVLSPHHSIPRCVAMDPTIRVVGAISLWAIEVIMQLRVYALFNCSRKVAIINAILFMLSVLAFIAILVRTSIGRSQVIAEAVHLPLPGCPVINSGPGKWAQWIPATVFECTLFGFALYSAISTRVRLREKLSVNEVLISDNILYFFGITVLLLMNNLMTTHHIPWFGYAPFHAAMGVMTTRMLMHLKKAACKSHCPSRGNEQLTQGNIDSLFVNLSNARRGTIADSIFSIPEPLPVEAGLVQCTPDSRQIC
ncbi:hypothetical protein NMY22_g3534 [Coprinellus aureogranulatus]|nr:hypothetical protein NMY22_g3534 [Coprinellus aureogranulatus]